MSHVVLLGDSTFDNGSYTAGGPDVISQVRQLLPAEWTATLSAVDGALSTCLSRGLPLVVCTIYHGNFEDDVFRQRAIVALTLFNDAIVRCAAEHQLLVIDLRFVCNVPLDFANPIEPSAIGGAKIARAIVSAVMEPSAARGRTQIATA